MVLVMFSYCLNVDLVWFWYTSGMDSVCVCMDVTLISTVLELIRYGFGVVFTWV